MFGSRSVGTERDPKEFRTSSEGDPKGSRIQPLANPCLTPGKDDETTDKRQQTIDMRCETATLLDMRYETAALLEMRFEIERGKRSKHASTLRLWWFGIIKLRLFVGAMHASPA